MKQQTEAHRAISQRNKIRKRTILPGIFLSFASIAILSFPLERRSYGENVAPTLSVDPGDNPNDSEDDSDTYFLTTSGGTATLNASGGSTDEPDDSQGCPPWTKTGNVQYTWYITNDDGSINTSVNDGDTTTEPSMTVDLDNAGTVEVQVSYQEQYQDSSDPATKVWSPADNSE